MIFGKRKKPRQFSYTPFYLNDEEDKNNNLDKIRFKRTRISKERKGLPIIIIILAVGIVLLMFYLNSSI